MDLSPGPKEEDSLAQAGRRRKQLAVVCPQFKRTELMNRAQTRLIVRLLVFLASSDFSVMVNRVYLWLQLCFSSLIDDSKQILHMHDVVWRTSALHTGRSLKR